MPNEYSELNLEITMDMEQIFKDELNLEIEMMQGERTVLPNGMISYKLKIYDDKKSDMIKEFCLKVISKSHNATMN